MAYYAVGGKNERERIRLPRCEAGADVQSQKDVSYTAVEMCFGNAATLCEDKNYKSCIQSCTLITQVE